MTSTTDESATEVRPDRGTVLFTGFPGFLGRRLVRRFHARRPGLSWVFLVEERLRERAEADLAAIGEELPSFAGRWETAPGDVTDPRLGWSGDRWAELAGRVTEVWHLAAVYDLAVPEQIARRVNVDGTRHVLDFCAGCALLRRLCYVSTCYVSGDHVGRWTEDDLEMGQGFKNHYEATKHAAEVEVRERWDEIPTVIFRPAVVVGDSRTGETDKYDGPYYFIRLMMRMPRLLPMTGIGRGEVRFNMVPVDFVVEAMAEIASRDGVEGKAFQLADPGALRVRDLLALISRTLGKPEPPFPSRPPSSKAPSRWARSAARWASPARRSATRTTTSATTSRTPSTPSKAPASSAPRPRGTSPSSSTTFDGIRTRSSWSAARSSRGLPGGVAEAPGRNLGIRSP